MLPQASYTIKPRTWPIWILFAMSGLPAIVILITESKKAAGLFLLGASCLFCLLLFLFTRFQRIYIDNDVLTYGAFGKKNTISWNEVAKSTVSWTLDGAHSVGPSWIFTSVDNKKIEMPLGYYSRSDMRILAEQTISKAKQATISPKIYSFAEGKFPWYLF